MLPNTLSLVSGLVLQSRLTLFLINNTITAYLVYSVSAKRCNRGQYLPGRCHKLKLPGFLCLNMQFGLSEAPR